MSRYLGMAVSQAEARDRRRAALAAAFAEVTTGGRIRLTPTVSIPEVLWRGLDPAESAQGTN